MEKEHKSYLWKRRRKQNENTIKKKSSLEDEKKGQIGLKTIKT